MLEPRAAHCALHACRMARWPVAMPLPRRGRVAYPAPRQHWPTARKLETARDKSDTKPRRAPRSPIAEWDVASPGGELPPRPPRVGEMPDRTERDAHIAACVTVSTLSLRQSRQSIGHNRRRQTGRWRLTGPGQSTGRAEVERQFVGTAKPLSYQFVCSPRNSDGGRVVFGVVCAAEKVNCSRHQCARPGRASCLQWPMDQ